MAEQPTGAAYIFVHEVSGENAIIVVPGAADSIAPADVEAAADAIRGAAVFVTQLEQPIPAAMRGLQIAREAGVITVFNPAPAAPVDDSIYSLCDYVTPNESEAALLTGLAVESVDDARRAADALLARGVGTALITLGEAGALLHTKEQSTPRARLQSRSGGRDDRGRRRLQRRVRRGARARRRRRRRPRVSAAPSPASR